LNSSLCSGTILRLDMPWFAQLRGRGWPAHALGLGSVLTPINCVAPADDHYQYEALVRVLDEQGEPIAGAGVDVEGRLTRTDRAGEVELRQLLGPVRLRVAATDYVTEPLAIDRHDAERGPIEVQLFAREGPQASPRWSMHVGGDAMLGRRYVAPEAGLPLLPAHDIGGAARDVVDDLAPLFGAADLRILNLETVVGDLPDSAIYPAKRFILLTPAAALSAFDELSVDLVTLANNHARDYLDLGVTHTLAALDEVGLAHVGASTGAEPASNPIILEPRPGIRMAVFSYTTVDGNFVNDSYADEDVAIPAECGYSDPPDECFMFEARSWGCEGPSVAIPSAARRIGPAWKLFAAAEPDMTRADQIHCWDTLISVYPEMQDWTARRGHGGAAGWDDETSPAAIAAADADVVMVQLHAGFQFQSAPSSGVKTLARNCIDAGADIVIAHHPHVLQGVEWYAGKLIAYSLGNIVFDQDFLATFTTAFLRMVWEGSTLIEARLIPIEIVGYRPIPVTGPGAARTAKLIWELGSTPAFTERDAAGDVRRYIADELGPDTEPGHVRSRHNSLVLTESPPPVEPVEVELAAGEVIAAIGFDGLIHAQAGGADIQLGRELFGWGHIEDVLADDEVEPAAQWFLPTGGLYDPILRLDRNAANGFAWLEMYRHAGLEGDTFVRPIGRLNLPAHRLFHDEDGIAIPADGDAFYSMRLRGRLRGDGQPFIRVELFEFIDTDPTEDPTTTPIGEPIDLPFTLTNDDEWHTVDVELDPASLWAEGVRANVVLVRVRFGPPSEGESVFAVDDFEFIEWRAATQMQDHFGDYAYLRSPVVGPASFTFEGMALHDD
jgi:poly-gamma-glutamate capsule biosynthesis protein CapA/YwtB (metallophosphatase superfamily)